MALAVNIIADHRELRSGLPDLLMMKGAHVTSKLLKAGDYLVNEKIIVERKTGDDFVLSIIQNRLFDQCSRLKKTDKYAIVLLEGNPFRTKHQITSGAIRGAMVSLAVSWQIPLLYAKNLDDSAAILLMLANQTGNIKFAPIVRGRKPRRLKSQVLFFLQGIPGVGAELAKLLLDQFSNLENILLASEDELMEVQGIGKNKARSIHKFLTEKH